MMSCFLSERRTLITSVVLCVVVLCVSFVSHGECQITPSPTAPCSSYTTCDACVPHTKCLWCLSTKNCTDYPVPWLLPPASLCPLSQARWGMCWINFEALIITIAVLAGIIIIGITVSCCYCCCCCCKKNRPSSDWEDERYARRRDEIRQRSEERNMDRKARHNEIRRKYGLMGDTDHPYSKFENE